MAMRKVPLYQKPLTFTTVEESATKGATVGLNLFWPDGSRVTEDELRQAASEGGTEVLGLMSVQVVPTASGQFAVQLAGDVQSPGVRRYYGTDLSGARGYHEIPDPPDPTVPYFIPDGETYTVAVNKQALFTIPIDLGVGSGLLIDGILAEVD